MPFNLRSVLSVAGPAILQGRYGDALTNVTQLALQPRPAGGPAPFVPTVPVALPGGAPTPEVQTTGTVVAAGVTAAAFIAVILRKIAAALGRRVSKAGVLDLIKRYGPTAAASALGITAAEALQFWVATGGQAKRFRRRGLTGRQLANATRVARTLQSMHRRFSEACRTVGYSRRRSTSCASKRKR